MLAVFYATFAAQLCALIYLFNRRHLSIEEKRFAWLVVVLSLPTVKFIVYSFLQSMHAGLYDAFGGDPARFDAGYSPTFNMLSWLAALAAPVGCLALFNRISSLRAADQTRAWERAQIVKQEQAVLALREAEQLKLNTQLAIRQTELQGMHLAAVRTQQIANQQSAEEKLLLAFDNFKLKHRDKADEWVREAFRAEIARRDIPKLNLRDLFHSDNPEVQAILRAVRQPALEP